MGEFKKSKTGTGGKFQKVKNGDRWEISKNLKRGQVGEFKKSKTGAGGRFQNHLVEGIF